MNKIPLKLISLLTAAALALFLIPVNVFADEINTADASEQILSAETSGTTEDGFAQQDETTDAEEEPEIAAGEEEVLKAAETNGKLAAELLEKIEDTTEYERMLRLVLDFYYTDGKTAQLEAFSAAAGERAAEIIENYSRAALERSREGELGYVPGEVLVVFNQDLAPVDASTAIDEALEGAVVETLDSAAVSGEPSVALVEIPLENTVEQAVEEILANDSVAFAEPNYLLEVAEENGDLSGDALMPNDPKSEGSYQWHLSKIKVPEAWEMLEPLTGREKVKIAVIDTSMDIDHEDLAVNINMEESVDVTGGVNSSMSEPQAHGTHVAGLVGATANNNIGVAGAASGYSNNIADVLLIGASHDERTLRASDIISGINWAIDHKADIINLSLGTSQYIFALETAVNSADAAGIMVVAAAGNSSNTKPYYPADFDTSYSVISVNNYTTTSENSKSGFSSYGELKDISAPGNLLWSTVVGGYSSKSGTSMAAPVVTSVAAMVMYANPELSRHEVKKILKDTAVDLYEPGFDIYTAWGCVDAEAAVASALAWNQDAVIPATGISFDETSLALDYGTYKQLTPKLAPENATEKVIWSSSKPAVARVSDLGKIVPVGIGEAVITAKTAQGGYTATCNVSVKLGSVEGLKAEVKAPDTVDIEWITAPGTGYSIAYRYDNGNKEYSKTIKGNPDFANSAQQLVKNTDASCEPGASYKYVVYSYASINGKNELCKSPKSVTVNTVLPEPEQLKAEAGTGDINISWNEVTYATGYNIYRATEDSGDFILIKKLESKDILEYTDTDIEPGVDYKYAVKSTYASEAFQSESVMSEQAAAKVPLILIEKLNINQVEAEIFIGDKVNLSLTMEPENTNNKIIKWTSSDAAVATVDAEGHVVGAGAGTAAITAENPASGVSAQCLVKVKAQAQKYIKPDKTELSIEQGKGARLMPQTLSEDLNMVVWRSSNSDVAVVKDGYVTAVKPGTATIYAELEAEGLKAECTVKVYAAVTEVRFPQKTLNLVKGKSVVLQAVAYSNSGSAAEVAYSSSNSNIAGVSSSGRISAKKTGTARITATAKNGKKAVLTVKVVNKASSQKTLTFSGVPEKVVEGDSFYLKGKVTPTTATGAAFKWKSSNTKVGTVDLAGRFTAKKAGKTTVTLTAGGKKQTVAIIVIRPEPSKISFAKKTVSMEKGKTAILKLNVSPVGAKTSFKYSSSNTKVVSVSSKGVVKALKAGKSTITAVSSNGKKARCSVVVK